jgi:hypothetical protein
MVVITNPMNKNAGDDFVYQCDVNDGTYSFDTWYNIIKYILNYELVRKR